jgi:hypothetical protein
MSPDMRRTVFVSAVGHVVVLLVLTALPVIRMPAREGTSYHVVLVTPSAIRPSAQHREIPVPPVKSPMPAVPKSMKPVPPPPKKEAPTAVSQALPAPPMEKLPQNPVARPLQSTPEPRVAKAVKTPEPVPAPPAIPKLGEFHRPDLPMDPTPPGPSPIQLPRQEVPTKPVVDRELMASLKKAEDNLNKPTTPLAPSAAPAPVTAAKRSRTAEEVTRELNQLSTPKAMKPLVPSPKEMPRAEAQPRQPTIREEVSRMLADARPLPEATPMPQREPAREVVVGPPAVAAATRAATLERCPPKAQRYCPVFEAAINRLWNADYNPAIRQVLESVGDSAVLILIEIRPDGVIQKIAVQESSGNKGYDLAIQSLLQDQKRFPPLPEELKNENFKAMTSFKYTRKI